MGGLLASVRLVRKNEQRHNGLAYFSAVLALKNCFMKLAPGGANARWQKTLIDADAAKKLVIITVQ
jgi:hypothetical protein